MIFIRSILFIVFSIITASKLTQTLSLTSLNFVTTLLLRRFCIVPELYIAEMLDVLQEDEERSICRNLQTTLVNGRIMGKYSKRRSGTRMEHCSYRPSVLFDLIPLLMSSIESYLSNKPKQCILKIK